MIFFSGGITRGGQDPRLPLPRWSGGVTTASAVTAAQRTPGGSMGLNRSIRSAGIVAGAALTTFAIVWGIAMSLRITSGEAAYVQAAPSPTWIWRTPNADGEIRYGSLLTRPAPGVVAAVSRDRAAAIAAHDFGTMAPGEVPRISLRLATRLPGERGGYENRLMWIVEYPNSPMMIFGPPGFTAEDRRIMEESGVCELVVMIDAVTGEDLGALQTCRKRSSMFRGSPDEATRSATSALASA